MDLSHSFFPGPIVKCTSEYKNGQRIDFKAQGSEVDVAARTASFDFFRAGCSFTILRRVDWWLVMLPAETLRVFVPDQSGNVMMCVSAPATFTVTCQWGI